MRLRHKILAAALLSTALPLGAAALLVYHTLTPVMEERTGHHVADLVDDTARTLGAFLNQRASEMRTFASEPVFRNGTLADITTRLEQLSLLAFFFDNFYFASPDGLILASTDKAWIGRSLGEVFPEVTPYLPRVQHAGTHQILISDFSEISDASRARIDSAGVRPTDLNLQMIARVPDRLGRVHGMLMGVLGSHSVAPFISDLQERTPGSESAYLLSSDGRTLVASNGTAPLMQVNRDWALLGAAGAAASDRNPFFIHTNSASQRVLTAAASTSDGGRGWVVMATTPYDVVMAPALEAVRRLIALLLALLVAATLGGVMAARALVRPIEAMTRAVALYGGGNLDARVNVTGSDEMAMLGRTLNEMTEARQQADAEQARFMEVLEATPDFVSFVDPATGRLLYMNPAGRRMAGIDRDEPIDGLTLAEMQPAWVDAMMRDEILPIIARDGVWVGETAFLHRDGREIPVLKVLLSHVGADGRVERLSAVCRDITAQRRIQEELKAAMSASEAATVAKSEFLATMSHEIRTPMNGVIGTVGLLLETDLTPHQRELAGIARSSADTLLRVINDILDASKIEAGKMTIEPAPFDMRRIVEELAEMFMTALQAKPVEIVIRYSPAAPRRFIGDAGRIRQVLANLVGNAMKFTAAGHVIIDVAPLSDAPGVRVSVADTGIGLTADVIARLFQRFVQADASTTRRFGGSGLGLSISRSLVELMGGTIGADGGSGKGATFWFTLPLPVDPARDPAPPCGTPPLAGLRVLVVDDHPVNRQTLTEQITGWRAHAETAASGAEALWMLRSAHEGGTPYDVAIIDHHMPDMDGVALGAEMRADPALTGVMTFLLTSLDTDRAATMRQGGFRACFTKPVRPSVLLDGLAMAWEARLCGAAALAEASHTTSPSRTHSRFGGRVLVADDNATNQRIAQLRLESVGCRVDVAGNGREALDLLQRLPYDLVLMDCEMPDMDGFAATAAIRAAEESTRSADAREPAPVMLRNPHRHRLPIVAMTASAMSGDRERCLAAGMDDYLSKPLDVGELMVVLDRWLGAQLPDAPPAGQGERRGAGDDRAAGEPERAATLDSTALRLQDPLDAGTIADLEMLAAAAGPEAFAQILRDFRRDAAGYLEALRAAVDAGDRMAVRDAGHTLKGASATIGAVALSAATRSLEMAGPAEPLAPLLAAVDREFSRASDAIARLLERDPRA